MFTIIYKVNAYGAIIDAAAPNVMHTTRQVLVDDTGGGAAIGAAVPAAIDHQIHSPGVLPQSGLAKPAECPPESMARSCNNKFDDGEELADLLYKYGQSYGF
jgi:hypothetical protein